MTEKMITSLGRAEHREMFPDLWIFVLMVARELCHAYAALCELFIEFHEHGSGYGRRKIKYVLYRIDLQATTSE